MSPVHYLLIVGERDTLRSVQSIIADIYIIYYILENGSHYKAS